MKNIHFQNNKNILPEEFIDVGLSILQSDLPEQELNSQLCSLWQYVIDYSLKDVNLHFTSLFSKLAYFCDYFQIDKSLVLDLHAFRKALINEPKSLRKDQNTYIYFHTVKAVFGIDLDEKVLSFIPKQSGFTHISKEKIDYIQSVKFVCTILDQENEYLQGYFQDYADELVTIAYNISDRNDRFTSSIHQITSKQLPQLMQLHEIELRADGIYYPTTFVIEPDFLVDVTSIASSFEPDGTQTLGYHLNKFFPIDFSIPLLVGNVANFMLDKLISDPHTEFQDILKEIFKVDPLTWAVMNNHDTSLALNQIKHHFDVIHDVVNIDFYKKNISVKEIYLEPSFYSALYGIQGRLDLLSADQNDYKIVELKSGSTFKPNVYSINNNHYTQTLLYDLLIRSVFPGSRPQNYILYSKYKENALRIAPRIAVQQKEALVVRNDILSIETAYIDSENLMREINHLISIDPENYSGFLGKKLERFQLIWHQLDDTEKAYFLRMTNFVAIEHRLAKIGEYGRDTSNGLAGLWLDSVEEKGEQFEMLAYLKIKDNKSMEAEPIIEFEYTNQTNQLSNFRKGDIAVLYPQLGNNGCLQNQVFKCSIIQIANQQVKVRLRSAQRNQTLFDQYEHWAIEHDSMDSNFLKMYRELFSWASGSKHYKSLVLTKQAPQQSTTVTDYTSNQLTKEQNQLMRQMISATNYYLVWGPPGTGKTSRVLKEYVKYYIESTNENIYLIAYTNRAVDEICMALDSLGESYKDAYLRIGSKYATAEAFQDRLFNHKSANTKRRSQLLDMIKSHRIIVGTLSSLLGKATLLDIIYPHQIVIDEASQILEPNIVGVLSRFDKFVMIGDHRQLPAVVVQSDDQSKVEATDLQHLGLWDCADSLFERLYRQCKANNWHHAIGILHQQGRMHEDIMHFSSKYFYDNQLEILDKIDRLKNQHQIYGIFDHRMNFVHSRINHVDRFNKTNEDEVQIVTSLFSTLIKAGVKENEIGIIAPFRAQTAAIKKSIESQYQEVSLNLHIDTVERFQGSAKDVIIISFCANNIFHLNKISSISHEGVDRKLNVALTRARELVILVGNENMLRKNPLYGELLDQCHQINWHEI